LTDIELISKIKEGDMDAFSELVKRYEHFVMSIAYSYRNSSEDMKDIYQEVFMRVHKAIKKFNQESEFSTWLYRISVNVCNSFYRISKKRKMESLNDYSHDVDGVAMIAHEPIDHKNDVHEKYIRDELIVKVKNMMEALPERQRMAITLKYLEGLKIREIAKIMRCGEGTIKRYIFNASGVLRKNLEPYI